MCRIARYVTHSMLAVFVVACCGTVISAGPATERRAAFVEADWPDGDLLHPTPSSFFVGVEQAAGQIDPTNVEPVEFEVTFGNAIDPLSFTASDIVQVGSATVGG